jgi:copper(I)-binding protein
VRRFSLFTLALALALRTAPALAQEFKAGDIVVEKPWVRATPKGAEVGGGFFIVRNKGAAPDRLTGGTADFATVEIHETSSIGGVSQMRELKDGLAIPAHGSVGLSPGGYHLMFTHLTRPLTKEGARQGDAQFRTCRPGRSRVRGDGRRGRGDRRHEGDGRDEDVKDGMRSRARAAICADRKRSSRSVGRAGSRRTDLARA